jgi:hypothetical protein
VHRGGDVGGAQRHLVDGRADGLERLAGALDGGGAVGRAPRSVLDDVDVARVGLMAPMSAVIGPAPRATPRQLADLLGDDGEAAALLARARRLDGALSASGWSARRWR